MSNLSDKVRKGYFNRALKFTQKSNSAIYKNTQPYQMLYDLPLMTMMKRLTGIKKCFKNIAFIGPNPYLFLQHLPKEYEVENFYYCEPSQESVEKSYEIINSNIESGFYEKLGVNQPENIVPKVINEEAGEGKWLKEFPEGSLDLIVNNMTFHWVNQIEGTFKQFNTSLEPDGVFMGATVGGDSLQELRISMLLAESEREGGISTIVADMLSI